MLLENTFDFLISYVFFKNPQGWMPVRRTSGRSDKRNTYLVKCFLGLLRRNDVRVPGATISTPENMGSRWFQRSLLCDGGSSVVAGQWSDSGAAGAAVPPHHLQHRVAGLQEDLGESLSDGLDPQYVCRLLLTPLLVRTSTRIIQQVERNWRSGMSDPLERF